MRRFTIAIALLAALVVNSGRAEAATLQVVLHLDGNKEVEIDIPTPPGEMTVLNSTWGQVTFNGALVAYYVTTRQDNILAGNQFPTNYPNPSFSNVMRTIGSPSDVLILQGTRQPLAEGGGAYGGVTVATGALRFLLGATYTQIATGPGVVLVTFTY